MPYPRQNTNTQSNAPAVNTAAVATLPAPGASDRWRIQGVIAGYATVPTGGLLTITDGASVNIVIPIATAGVVLLSPLDIQCGPNRAVTATVAAGGAAVSGFVTLIGVFE